jgi:hypothetical protein
MMYSGVTERRTGTAGFSSSFTGSTSPVAALISAW